MARFNMRLSEQLRRDISDLWTVHFAYKQIVQYTGLFPRLMYGCRSLEAELLAAEVISRHIIGFMTL